MMAGRRWLLNVLSVESRMEQKFRQEKNHGGRQDIYAFMMRQFLCQIGNVGQ